MSKKLFKIKIVTIYIFLTAILGCDMAFQSCEPVIKEVTVISAHIIDTGLTNKVNNITRLQKKKLEAEKRLKIKRRKEAAKKRKYKSNLYILSHVISGEARGSTYKDMLYVGSVVLNRVQNKKFPNTIKGVVFAHNQYACTWDGNYNVAPNAKCLKAAKYLLKHGSQLPKKVVWQSGVALGKPYVYEGGHWYCY